MFFSQVHRDNHAVRFASASIRQSIVAHPSPHDGARYGGGSVAVARVIHAVQNHIAVGVISCVKEHGCGYRWDDGEVVPIPLIKGSDIDPLPISKAKSGRNMPDSVPRVLVGFPGSEAYLLGIMGYHGHVVELGGELQRTPHGG